MTVTYPRKFRDQYSARDILSFVVRDRTLHLQTLNSYRYSEQRACKDLTGLIERLDGQNRELIRDLSRHIHDEARHAQWLTELLYDCGAELNTPVGLPYVDAFERLLDAATADTAREIDVDAFTIETLAAINATEKRGCLYFSAHLWALSQRAEDTAENRAVRETIARILPEEAGHVRWGNRWLVTMARLSPAHAERVEAARRKYTAIEQAAFEAGIDITLGAELRRFQHLVTIAETLPPLERVGYLLTQLPRILPETQVTRLSFASAAFRRDPVRFVQTVLPALLSGGQSRRAATSA